MARIRIGTASWTDPGFIADWYPAKLPAGERLRWYAEQFDYVEVNSTFYAIPNARTVERWVQETPDDFLFDVKLPKVLSRHRMEARFLPPDLRSRLPQEKGVVQLKGATERLVMARTLRELNPLRDAGKLGAFLLQLSPAFSPRRHALEELDTLREHMDGVPLAVELRNRDWVSAERREATEGFFRKRGMTFVLVDAPESEHFTVMPGMECVTNPRLGYFRFHGRNETGYIAGRSVAERFDYDYSEAEVEELAARIRKVAEQVEELRVVANNNRSNYAPRLAEKLLKLLNVQRQLGEQLERKQAAPRKKERQQELF